MASVGKHIRNLRTARHMTQEELSEKLFVTRQAVSAWETGKALPDVETLERIAAALNSDVTEVIYGVRQAPDLRRIKRRWALFGFLAAMLLTGIYIVLLKNGSIGTWQYGLRYHLWDPSYITTYEPLNGSWSVELDLNDLESNEGKILYEDESGCCITVSEVSKKAPYEYRVFLRSHGAYDHNGGQLVSGSFHPLHLSTSFIPTDWPKATASVAGLNRSCPLYQMDWLDRKDGNQIVFHLSSTDSRNTPLFCTDFLEAQSGTITFTVYDLTRLTTRRIPQRVPY